MLRCALLEDETRWSQLPPLLGFTCDSASMQARGERHSSCCPGSSSRSPFAVLRLATASGLGLRPLQAETNLQKVKEELKAQEYTKKHAVKIRRPAQFDVGQWVWLSTV